MQQHRQWGWGGSGLAEHRGSASAWQHQAPGDSSTHPPGLGPAVGCCHPPLQPGHLHPGLLQAQLWEKATKAGMTASTLTIPSARLWVLSTLGAPAGLHRDPSSAHSEAACATCPSPFSPLGSYVFSVGLPYNTQELQKQMMFIMGASLCLKQELPLI